MYDEDAEIKQTRFDAKTVYYRDRIRLARIFFIVHFVLCFNLVVMSIATNASFSWFSLVGWGINFVMLVFRRNELKSLATEIAANRLLDE